MGEQEQLFTFTKQQMEKLLHNVIDLYDENRGRHQLPVAASNGAIQETFEALDSELEMWMASEGDLTLHSSAYVDQGLALLAQEIATRAYKNYVQDLLTATQSLLKLILNGGGQNNSLEIYRRAKQSVDRIIAETGLK